MTLEEIVARCSALTGLNLTAQLLLAPQVDAEHPTFRLTPSLRFVAANDQTNQPQMILTIDQRDQLVASRGSMQDWEMSEEEQRFMRDTLLAALPPQPPTRRRAR